MNYTKVLYESFRDLLAPMLLIPDESLGRLFRTAVGYIANEPIDSPLPPGLWAAWEQIQTQLDADVQETVSVRTALHLTACRRYWFLEALADEDAGRLAARFIRSLMGEQPELPAPLHVRESQLQQHFFCTKESLERTVPDRILHAYTRARTALAAVQDLDPMPRDEFDYLTGCLVLLILEESGETMNGQPTVEDAPQLSRLFGARWLLTGGAKAELNMRRMREEAESYLASQETLPAAVPAPPAEPERPAADQPAVPESAPEPPKPQSRRRVLPPEPPREPAPQPAPRQAAETPRWSAGSDDDFA
ncbi:MAG: hypothetical protein HDQ87_03645 [Clostridia bacterium]|nr:hypothetical protein [Clostridia bacterium]